MNGNEALKVLSDYAEGCGEPTIWSTTVCPALTSNPQIGSVTGPIIILTPGFKPYSITLANKLHADGELCTGWHATPRWELRKGSWWVYIVSTPPQVCLKPT